MQATGFIWVGGKEPPAVTASVQAALGHRRAATANPPASIAHKVPPPSYWRPRPGWPGRLEEYR
jgi:hypothetical protein